MDSLQNSKDKEVYLTHVFNASREIVFAAWTDPKQLMSWYAPKGCYIVYEKIDVRTGGQYHSCIHDPVHGECWCKGTYLEIAPLNRIVFTMQMTDRDGNDLQSIDAGKDEQWPSITTVTVSFKEIDGKTELILQQTVSAKLANTTGALPGWISMLNRLSSILDKN
jgi:uncharacterized protein YndB with AHSA1/START domain